MTGFRREALPCSRVLTVLGTLFVLTGCRTALLEARIEDLPEIPARSLQDAPQKKKHPANEGIDEDGSVARGQMPQGLNNPHRWRYVPEGRLMEGSPFERLWISTFLIPIFFYDEALGSGFGFNYTDLNFNGSRRKQMINIGATYSSEGQQRIAAFWRRRPEHREVKGGGIVFEENSSQAVGAGYTKTPTRRFFGLGPNTPETAATSYTDERTAASFMMSSPIPNPGDSIIYDAGLTVERRDLGMGKVSHLPSTDVAFPVLFAAGDSYDMLWVKGAIRYDILDSPSNPYQGFAIAGEVDLAPAQTDSNFGAIFGMRGEWAHQVPSPFHDGGKPGEENPPTDTIAIGGFIRSSSGDLPFWALPSLGGGKTQRGYIANRFTDRAAWNLALEYRFWPISRGAQLSETFRIERMGMALFYEVGSVARRVERFGSATARHSYGVSLRLTLDRTSLFRIDFGASREGLLATIAFGLPF